MATSNKDQHAIEVTAGAMERIMMQQEWDSIKKKEFDRKVRYWLGRIFNRADQEMKPYFEQKQDVIDKNAQKKDDSTPIIQGNQVVFGKNRKKALAELDELGKINLDFGNIWRVVLEADAFEEMKLTLGEEMILQHFVFQKGMDDV